MKCPLCKYNGNPFYKNEFYICTHCSGIYKNSDIYLNIEEEKARYQKHINDVNDAGYQKFVSPIVSYVLNNYSSNHTGLDFGSGTGSVISKLLKDNAYNIEQYDPFFADNKEALSNKYDYIVSCEVIEHFKNGNYEFNKLSKMLNPNGKLICMTHLFEPKFIFEKWYYKDDPTHVFIYQKETVSYIADFFYFKSYSIEGRLIIFKN